MQAVSVLLHDPSGPTPLQRAVKLLGGQSSAARALGISQQRVWVWLNRSPQRVPAEFCTAIEKCTQGAIRARELRPDVFNFDVLGPL